MIPITSPVVAPEVASQIGSTNDVDRVGGRLCDIVHVACATVYRIHGVTQEVVDDQSASSPDNGSRRIYSHFIVE